jgi:opacity protein-like surface antigen
MLNGDFMRRFLIIAISFSTTTSALAADAAHEAMESPIVAPRISGYGEIYLGGLKFSDEDDTLWTGGGTARVNIPFAQRWNIQIDGTYDRVWDSFNRTDGIGGAVHAYYRDPNLFAAGLFASIKDFGGDIEGVYDYAGGPEAQVYFGNLTLYGQAYYGKDHVGDFIDDLDEWGVRGVARYFVRKNLRLDAEIAYNVTDAGSVSFDTVGMSVQAMYRFDATPWSVFGRYQFDRLTIESNDIDTNKFLIGIRASFGSDSLFDEDRNGATMDTYHPNLLAISVK